MSEELSLLFKQHLRSSIDAVLEGRMLFPHEPEKSQYLKLYIRAHYAPQMSTFSHCCQKIQPKDVVKQYLNKIFQDFLDFTSFWTMLPKWMPTEMQMIFEYQAFWIVSTVLSHHEMSPILFEDIHGFLYTREIPDIYVEFLGRTSRVLIDIPKVSDYPCMFCGQMFLLQESKCGHSLCSACSAPCILCDMQAKNARSFAITSTLIPQELIYHAIEGNSASDEHTYTLLDLIHLLPREMKKELHFLIVNLVHKIIRIGPRLHLINRYKVGKIQMRDSQRVIANCLEYAQDHSQRHIISEINKMLEVFRCRYIGLKDGQDCLATNVRMRIEHLARLFMGAFAAVQKMQIIYYDEDHPDGFPDYFMTVFRSTEFEERHLARSELSVDTLLRADVPKKPVICSLCFENHAYHHVGECGHRICSDCFSHLGRCHLCPKK